MYIELSYNVSDTAAVNAHLTFLSHDAMTLGIVAKSNAKEDSRVSTEIDELIIV